MLCAFPFFLQTEFKTGQEKGRLVFIGRMRTFGKGKKIQGTDNGRKGVCVCVCVCLENESKHKFEHLLFPWRIQETAWTQTCFLGQAGDLDV